MFDCKTQLILYIWWFDGLLSLSLSPVITCNTMVLSSLYLSLICFLTSQVLLRTACSSSRRTNSIDLFYSRHISSVKVVSFSNMSNYCTNSGDNISSSKRRSRGPVMAGMKASEGSMFVISHCFVLLFNLLLFILLIC